MQADPFHVLVLERFCRSDHNHDKYDLRKPFNVGDHVYATDTIICARVPGNVETKCNGKHPPVEDEVVLKWDSVFPITDPHAIPHSACNAKKIQCDQCKGNGYTLCNCPSCTAEHDCTQCNGDGEVEENDEYEIHDRRFATKQLRRVLSLPGVRVKVIGCRMAFESGPIQGVLMGLAEPKGTESV